MGDWLGTGRIADHLKEFRPFHEARAYAESLGLRDQKEWVAFAKSGKRPADVPSNPQSTYRASGWRGYGDWLGTGNKRGGQKKRR